LREKNAKEIGEEMGQIAEEKEVKKVSLTLFRK
jgi:hypothetical protein